MPGRIHDWRHVYWRNRDASRVFDEEGIEPDENVLSIHRNEAGESVALEQIEFEDAPGDAPEDDSEDDEEPEQVAVSPEGVPEDTEATYAVTFNGELVTDFELDGETTDFLFDTRADARKAGTELRRTLPPIPDEESLEEMDYDELMEIAKPRGYSRNDGTETIIAGLTA